MKEEKDRKMRPLIVKYMSGLLLIAFSVALSGFGVVTTWMPWGYVCLVIFIVGVALIAPTIKTIMKLTAPPTDTNPTDDEDRDPPGPPAYT